MYKKGELRYVSNFEFAMKMDGAVNFGSNTRLYCSPISSLTHACKLLTIASRGVILEKEAPQTFTFSYNKKTDNISLTLNGCKNCIVRVLPTRLAVTLGMSTVPHTIRSDLETLPSGPTNAWSHVNLPPGFYAPCHRSMCTGQPMRINTEVENAVNRFYFPLPSSGDNRMNASPSTPHAIVFIDPSGRTQLCPIPCGRYSPENLCAHLQKEMSSDSGNNIRFTIDHDNEKFTFKCFRILSDQSFEPANFSILFNHPLCTDAWRFGFPEQPLTGGSSYTACDETKPLRTDPFHKDSNRVFSNLIRFGEVGAEKRFEVHAITPPSMTAVCIKNSNASCVFKTFVNKLPFAHGLQEGDVVRLVSLAADATVLEKQQVDEERVEWSDATSPAASLPKEREWSALVSSVGPGPNVVGLLLPTTIETGSSVSLAMRAPEPWNLCFSTSLLNTIDAYILGFPAGQ